MAKFLKTASLGLGLSLALLAQTGDPSGVDLRTSEKIHTEARDMLAKAKTVPDGTQTVTLEKYSNSYTMIATRAKFGGAEVHDRYADFFIPVEGDATVLTGGKVIDGKEISPGEIRGTRVEGGTAHVLHKGDVLHIMPGIPHQTTVPAGKTFIYYVIKVDEKAGK